MAHISSFRQRVMGAQNMGRFPIYMAVPVCTHISVYSLLRDTNHHFYFQTLHALKKTSSYFQSTGFVLLWSASITPLTAWYVWQALSTHLCPSHGICTCFTLLLVYVLEPAWSLLQKRNTFSWLRWMLPITSAAWYQAKVPLQSAKEKQPLWRVIHPHFSWKQGW